VHVLLEGTSFFSEFANFTKQHPYFRSERFAELVKIL
jgi:hypothetical protein